MTHANVSVNAATSDLLEEQLRRVREHLARGVPRGRPASGKPLRDENGKRQLVTELKPWHERVVDYFLENPSAKQVDVAAAFGVTQPWLSTLMNSDSFKRYAAERMAAHRERVSEAIVGQTQEVAQKALEVVSRKLDEPGKVSIGEANAAAKTALTALGYGPKFAPGVQTTNNLTVVAASPEVLARAREAHAKLAGTNTANYLHTDTAAKHVIDAQASDLIPAPTEDIEDAEFSSDQ